MKNLDPKRCQDTVWHSIGWKIVQCSRKGTITENDKKWCFQHAPSAIKKRQAESEAKYNAETERHAAPYKEAKRLRVINKDLLEALEAIVKGVENGFKGYPKEAALYEIRTVAEPAIKKARES